MTNKYIYFVANWKMFGGLNSLKSLNKVINFSKNNKNNKFKLIYCPPFTLINLFIKKLEKTKIFVGAQNCHEDIDFGPHTGSINSKMLKDLGSQYVILGHSENRANGENDNLINKKIKSALKNNLKIIFCFGETLSQRKKNLTSQIFKNQIENALKGVTQTNRILFAYEPIWSIGTGIILQNKELEKNVQFIKKFLLNNFKLKSPKVLYGGSVNTQNINLFKKLNIIDGFLIGGASQNSNKFIDIVKKTFN